MSNQDDFDPSPFQKVAAALSGLSFIPGGPFSGFTSSTLECERLIAEIAVIANIPAEEVKDFYQTHSCSLGFIKAALLAGAKLDEEEIKQTMEERNIFGERLRIGIVSLPKEQEYTFIVILPNNERREVKAAYMEVDGSTLYFENDDHETILAFGPGHWIWAERVEDDQDA